MKKNSMRLLSFLLVAVMMVSLLGLGVFAGDTANDVNETASQTSETLTWKDGDVIDGITISTDVTINVSGTVTVNGTIRLAPDAICNVVFNGSENAKLIRGEGFTGQMFYAEGTSDNFQKLTFNNITLDGGAVWTGDVDKTLNRGTTNAGVKATGSVLYLVYANATLENGSVLQNHDDSTGEKANAVFLRYYSTFTVNDSIVRNNNSISTYYRGGVVTIRQGGTVKTNNADVYGNSGPAGGFVGISSTGAFGGIVEVKDSKFHNNYADNGAVFLMQCNSKIGYLSIEGCEFYENASKTAVLTEWAYSRPFIIKDSYFHDNECAVWDCNADPVLDLSGKIVVEEDADYTKYLFETPLVLGGALADGSSIAISEASLTKLLSTKAYVVTGTADYAITNTDLAKFVLPEGYKFLVADVNFDGIMDAVPVDVDFVVSHVTVTLKDSLDADASETRTVIAGLAYDYGTSSAHTGFTFTSWQKDDGKAVNAPIAVTSDSILTAQWKLANPSVAVSVNGATLTATISNANEDIAYTYQWYIDGTAIDGATADTYTMTDLASHKYRCTVTASYEGYKSTSGKKEVTASVPAAARIGDVKYETLAEAIAAANAADGATTVTLLADVTLSEKLTITGDVTIEGAYTITRGDAYTGTLFTVNAGATLTLDGGLTIDGGNNWAYTVFPPVMDLENGSGTKVADHITPAEGGVNATAHMIVNNGTLNVHSVTIENSYSTGEVSLINAGANSVTILDGATIRHTAANRSGAVANIGGIDAILTIKGTTRITDNFGVGNGGIIQNYGQGTTVNLEGGSIDNNFVGKSGALYASYSSNANKINTFNMTGGIITENVMEGYGPVYIHTNTVWNMSGGEISENVSYLPSYVRNNNPAGSMTGGKIANNEITGLDYSGGYYLTRPDLRLNGKTAITGGIYSQNVFEYIAPNTGVAYDDGLYTVVSEGLYKLHLTDPVTGEPATIPYIEGNVLASLVATGKLFYADYYEMTLEVLYDVKVDETAVIDYPMTIDLNGHTITGYSTMQTTPVFRVVSDVTVIGEGKVDGRPGSACYAFIVGQDENAGNLTIENGTFYGDTSAISVTKGTATINGGKFAVTPYQEDNYNFLLNCIDKNYKDGTAKIVVKGGTFYKFNPENNAAEGAGTDFVPETHISVDNGDGTFTVQKAVAKVGDTYFATLQDAFAACTNGETITLLVDLTYGDDDVVAAIGGATGFGDYYNPTINYVGGTRVDGVHTPSNVNAVLDLNGHTITNNADAYLFLFMDNCKVTIKDSKDGDGIINYANLPIIWACGTDTLVTIENGKYYNGNEAYGSLIHSTHAADIVIKGGEFKTALAEAPDLLKINTQKFNNPNYFLVGKATMTVTGGTFYGFNPEYTGDTYTKTDVDTVPETHAVYDNGDGSYTVMTYVEWIKAQLLAGNDVTLDRDIIVDGSMIESIPAPTNGNGRYPNYGIFNVVGDYDVTFDLNGHSITYNGHESFEWNGKTVNSCTVAHGLFFANDGAHLTIVGEGDVIVNGVASGVYSASPDTAITIQGGNWVNNGCAECGATNLFLYASHGGELYIEGGRFEQALDSEGNSYLIVVHGGEYKNSVIDFAKTKIVISGGTFVGMDPSKAHYFQQTADNKLAMGETVDTVAEGFKAADNGDGSYTVIDYIKWIKAQLLAGNDVVLDRDVVVNSDYTTSEDCLANGFGQYKNWGIFTVISGDVTFDLNGHNVTYTGHSENFCNKVAEALFYANNGAKLTIVDSSADKTGSVDVYGMATAVYSTGIGSVATVKGGTWNGYECPECGAFNVFLYASHGGELYIEDGYFSQNGLEDSSLGSILIVEQSGAVKNPDALVDFSQTKVEITGGTFVGMDPEQAVEAYQKTWSSIVWGNTNIVAEGKMSYEVKENVWIIISADIVVKLETEGSDEVKFFNSIADAMARARETEGDDTVYLLKNHKESLVVIYDGTTLDLQTYTLEADYVVSFAGGYITGAVRKSSDTYAKLIVPKQFVALAENAAAGSRTGAYVMPVWDATANNNEGAFVFAELGIGARNEYTGVLMNSQTGKEELSVGFAINGSTYVKENLLLNQDLSGLHVEVVASWNRITLNENGEEVVSSDTTTQVYRFSDESLRKAIIGEVNENGEVQRYGLRCYIPIEGHANLTMYARFVTDAGVVICGEIVCP